jgi:dihydroorotate dehydrogenase
MWERFGLSVMRRMDPERAHALAIAALKTGLLPLSGARSPRPGWPPRSPG